MRDTKDIGTPRMSSYGQYKRVSDVVSDLNVMIQEAPIHNKFNRQLADIVWKLKKLDPNIDDAP